MLSQGEHEKSFITSGTSYLIHIVHGKGCQCEVHISRPGPENIKLISCSAQLRLKLILLINVKMSTMVGISTFISRINFRLWQYKLNFNHFWLFHLQLYYEQFKFHAQLS